MLGKCYLMLQCARRVQSCITACLASDVSSYSVLGKGSLVLRRARRVQRYALCYGMLRECYLALRCARRVLFCFTACLANVVTRCSVLAESSLTLRHDWRVLFHVTACLTSAVLCYRIIGKCCLALRHAW